MYRLFSVLIVLFLLIGCGSSDESESETATETSSVSEPTGDPNSLEYQLIGKWVVVDGARTGASLEFNPDGRGALIIGPNSMEMEYSLSIDTPQLLTLNNEETPTPMEMYPEVVGDQMRLSPKGQQAYMRLVREAKTLDAQQAILGVWSGELAGSDLKMEFRDSGVFLLHNPEFPDPVTTTYKFMNSNVIVCELGARDLQGVVTANDSILVFSTGPNSVQFVKVQEQSAE